MTSQGHPYARFRRLLGHGRSLTAIRAAAAELPGPVPLDDALELCLLLLEREPERFDSAAARWAGRLILEQRLAVVDAQLALSAIAALSRGDRRGGAEALLCLCERYRLDHGEEILAGWLTRQGLAV